MIRPILAIVALAGMFSGTAFAEVDHTGDQTKVATFEELMLVSPEVRSEYVWNVVNAVEIFEQMAYARLGKDSAQIEILRDKMQALKSLIPEAEAAGDASSSFSTASRARATLNSDQGAYDAAFLEYNQYMSPLNHNYNANRAADLEDRLATARGNLKDSTTTWKNTPDRERLASSDSRREFDGKSCSYIKTHPSDALAKAKEDYAKHRGPRHCMYGGQFGDWTDGAAKGSCTPHDCKDGKQNIDAKKVQCNPQLVCRKNSERMSLQDRAVCVPKGDHAFLDCMGLYKGKNAKYDRDCVHANNADDVKAWVDFREELKSMCNGRDSKHVERVLFCDECLELDARLDTALGNLGSRTRTNNGRGSTDAVGG